ncbi:MAG TPA: STAS domain-containing protein [Burkholderiales bacterium]|jgi:anti-anti-sigma factor|nr:STAS domain-containing protein [Burkholderiales bacterium]
MELHQHDLNGVIVMEVKGRIDSVTAPDFRGRIDAILSAPQSRLLLDMQRLEYISSAGFRILYLAARRTGEGGGSLAICGLSDTVRELFAIAGFLKHFRIFASREEGVGALQ